MLQGRAASEGCESPTGSPLPNSVDVVAGINVTMLLLSKREVKVKEKIEPIRAICASDVRSSRE